MGANAMLVTGTSTNTGGTIRFSGGTNGLAIGTGTIEYYGSSQTIAGGTYSNLTISQSSGQAIAGGDITINGILNLNSGNFNLISANTLILGSLATISGASPAKMIIATAGSEVRKIFTGLGSFTFPVGDNTSTTEYSPITINLTSADAFASEYVGISVVDAKHPNNSSAANFLSRYWNVTQSGITNCIATITGTYLAADLNGAAGDINSAQLNGAFDQSANSWSKYSVLSGTTLTTVGAALTAGQTSVFTGIRGLSPTASINIGAGATICNENSISLVSSVSNGGDAPFTYSWSPTTGLSATNIINPIASPTSTQLYEVTVTDANGISDTESTTVTVNALPSTPTISTIESTVCDGVAVPDVTLTSSVAPNSGTYVWHRGGIATGDTGISIDINGSANNGDYTVSVIDGISLCESAQKCHRNSYN